MFESPRVRASALCAGLSLILAMPSRAQDPAGPSAEAYKQFNDLMAGFAKSAWEKLPAGDQSPRENAYGKCYAAFFVALMGGIAMPIAGAAVGGGIGACCDGVGAVPGAAVGSGVGLCGSTAGLVAAGIYTIYMVDQIESDPRYAPDKSAGGGMYILGPDRAEFEFAKAGTNESLYVAAISLLPDEFLLVADKWDALPGLNEEQQRWLKSVDFVRPQIQKLAWIKRNHRASPNALPAQDVKVPFVGDVMIAERRLLEWTTRQMGACPIVVTGQNGALVLPTPPSLRSLGAPAEGRCDLPGVEAKIDGPQGSWIGLSLRPGPFQIELRDPKIDNREVVMAGVLKKGSNLGGAEVKACPPHGREAGFGNVTPALNNDVSVKIRLKLTEEGFLLNSLEIGDLDLATNIPEKLRSVPMLGDKVNDFCNRVRDALQNCLRDRGSWVRVFTPIQQTGRKVLLSVLQRSPGAFGLAGVKVVDHLRLEGGKLLAKVDGFKLPGSPQAVIDAFIAEWNQHGQRKPPVLERKVGPVGPKRNQ